MLYLNVKFFFLSSLSFRFNCLGADLSCPAFSKAEEAFWTFDVLKSLEYSQEKQSSRSAFVTKQFCFKKLPYIYFTGNFPFRTAIQRNIYIQQFYAFTSVRDISGSYQTLKLQLAIKLKGIQSKSSRTVRKETGKLSWRYAFDDCSSFFICNPE